MVVVAANAQPPLRVGAWMLITGLHAGPLIGFTYVDREHGLCAKGGPPDQDDLGTRPSVTIRTLPWPNLQWRFLSADEVARLQLPALPDWVRFYGPQPQPGITWDPLVDDDVEPIGPRAGSAPPTRAPGTGGVVRQWKAGDDIEGLFVIEEILGGPGKSGMGTVYVGESSMFGGRCAVKTLQDHLLRDAALLARFRREALTWIRFDAHDNIVQALAWQVLGGRPCLFMEYGDGGDLTHWIGRGRLAGDPELVLRFAIDFCNGMTHAVAKGLRVHRDIKPQNCVISGTDSPVLKVTDFGLANAMELAPGGTSAADPGLLDVHATQHGQAIGTCTHMAPEQFVDARRVDVRADIYAFGVMLFQMVTGRLPFEGRTWQEFERLHATGLPPPLPAGALQMLEPLIRACLAKDPARRCPGFAVVRAELVDAYRALTGSDPTEGNDRPLDLRQLRNKANSLAFLGRPDEAIDVADLAIAGKPEDAGDAWVLKVQALRSSGRFDDALACAQEAEARLPALTASNALLWWGLWMTKGETLWALGRLEESLDYFDKAVAVDASVEFGWSRRAEVLARLERHAEAAESAARLVALTPESPDAWLRLGESLRKSGRAGDAIPAFDRAITLGPTSIAAWANRGLALAASGGQGDRETEAQALYSMDQAIAISPRDPEPWFHKAMLLVFYKQEDEALACLAEAHRLGHPSAATMIDVMRSRST